MDDQPQTAHFNGLTPPEAERLAILAEECAEVIQIIGKVLRHGYASCNPFDADQAENRRLLEKEIGHVTVAIALLTSTGDIDNSSVGQAAHAKRRSIRPWLHYHHVVAEDAL